MQLCRLEVKNWCQFAEQTCDFGPGLTALLGANGSGKSNLIGAVRWLMTGVNPNAGVKEDNIYQLSDRSSRAFGRLRLRHNGHEFVITRHLRPTSEKSTLLVDEVPVARGDNAVNSELVQRLGVDANMLNRFVLVAQDDIFGFLDDQNSKVAEFFQRLFDTRKADVCYNLITKQLSRLAISEVGPQVDQVQQRLREAATEVARLQALLATMPALSAAMAELNRDRELLLQWRERERLDTQLSQLRTHHDALAGQLAMASLTLQQHEADITALEQAIATGDADMQAARLALANWHTYRQLQTQRFALQSRAQSMALERTAHPEPVAIPVDGLEAYRNERNQCLASLSRSQQMVRDFDQTGMAECPTCHTPVETIKPLVEIARQQIPVLTGKVEELSRQISEIERYQSDKNRYDTWQIGYAQRLSQLQQDQAALDATALAMPDRTDEELQAVVTGHQEYVDALTDLRPTAQQVRDQVARMRGQLSQQLQTIGSLEQQLAANTVTRAAAQAAEAAVPQREQQIFARQGYERELAAAERQFTLDQQQLIQLQEQQALAEKQRSWINRAEAWRGVLHYNAAPRFVAQTYLQQLQHSVNELLQQFDTSFRVTASEGLTFTASFPDGRTQPAKRLSGGQKVVLALAFRIAVNSMFAGSLGLLVLDEPTAYLDEQHIQGLTPVLERLRSLSSSNGLQCLMVTHESQLAPLFESVVQL